MTTLDFSNASQVPDNVSAITGNELIFGSASRATLPKIYKFPFTTSGVTNPVVTFYGVVTGRNNFTVTDGTTTNFRITNDLVGVGTASPDAALTVEKNGTHSYDLLTLKNTSNTNTIPVRFKMSSGNAGFLVNTTISSYTNAIANSGAVRQNGTNINADGVGGLTVSASNAAGELRFYTGGVADVNEAIHVFSNGRVSIGYSGGAYADNGYALEVYGTIKATNLIGSFPLSSVSGGQLTVPLNEAPATTLASAASVDIGASQANTINITGSATITSFGTSASGIKRTLIFAGSLTLTYNASTMILPTSANITTAAGDVMEVVSLGGGAWKCIRYERLSGKSVGLGNVDNTSDANKPVSTAQQTALNAKQDTSGKDASNGYAGLTLLKINFKNVANTFTSFLTNTNTAARTYTFPDKDITVAGIVDIPPLASAAPANLAAAAAVGTSANAAREDHVHAYPTALQSGASIPNALSSAAATVSAAGSTQGTATLLSADYNKVTTVAAGAGVRLPSAAAGKAMTIVNKGANALLVYPATSQSLDALAANTAISVPVGYMLEVWAVGTTQWDTSMVVLAGVSAAVTVTDDTATASTVYPVWSTGTSGNISPKVSSTKISFVPSTGTLTLTTVVANLTGTATNATNIAVTDDTATATTVYPLWSAATSGNNAAKVSSTKISFVPSTGTLTAVTFVGALTGNATNVTGIVAGANGGTGVNNSGKTITLGGNLTTSGAFASTFTMTNTTTVTFPTTGTLATLAGSETLTNKVIGGNTIDGTNTVGYMNVPAVSAGGGGTYTLVLTDQGKHIQINNFDLTVPDNTSVAFPVGTVITIVNTSTSANRFIGPVTNTIYQAGTGVTGARTLAPYGIATLLKISSVEWLISGTGLS